MSPKSANEIGPCSRDGELACRIAELLWMSVGSYPEVVRRRRVIRSDKKCAGLVAAPRTETEFGKQCVPIAAWVVEKWCALFDEWERSPETHAFADGFESLFFIRILWANSTLILRGHYDSNWELTTSSSRFSAQFSRHDAEEAEAAAQRFLEELEESEVVRRAYPSRMPPSHQEAILQHYGFPTNLLDFTYLPDVALFFAEGGTDYLRDSSARPARGAIYAVPAHALPRKAELVTLPPLFLRPSLQRAAFLRGLSDSEREGLASYRVLFAHHATPVWNGLGGIRFGSPIGLGKYLLPLCDPVADAATRCRRGTSLDKQD